MQICHIFLLLCAMVLIKTRINAQPTSMHMTVHLAKVNKANMISLSSVVYLIMPNNKV